MTSTPTALPGARTLMTVVAALIAVVLGAGGSGEVDAAPYSPPNLVTTLRCDTANPWPGPRIAIWVDVYNQIAYPSDGLPGPAIAMIGSSRSAAGFVEFTSQVRVSWRNGRTGRSGSVTVAARAHTVTWQVVLHPGSGPIALTVAQTVGAMAVIPMVNPQHSACSGRASA